MEDPLARVEFQRVKLEENVAQLQQILRQWQTWEAEYDSLREEVNSLPETATGDAIAHLARDFGSQVVSRKEIEELAGTNGARQRSPGQVAALISRRIDYVQQNCKTAANQLERAQAELYEYENGAIAGADNSASSLTEIVEQLDEDDNVISSKVIKPDESTRDIVNMLQRAGLSNELEGNAHQKQPKNELSHENLKPTNAQVCDPTALSNDKTRRASSRDVTSSGQKKAVRFAEDTKVAMDETPEDTANESGSTNKVTGKSRDFLKGSVDSNEKVWELDENDQPIDFHSPYIPADESPEDAALRREMLKYNMAEVGAVVAQLDLEDDSDESYFSEDADDTVLGSSSDDEEEDEHGRTTRPMLSEDYRKEMAKLEQKLNAQLMQNIGRPTPNMKVEPVEQHSGNDVIYPENMPPEGLIAQRERTNKPLPSTEKPETASSPHEQPVAKDDSHSSSAGVFRDEIFERSEPRVAPKTEPTTLPQKTSRFKKARNKLTHAERSEMEASDTLSSTVIERPPKTAPQNRAKR